MVSVSRRNGQVIDDFQHTVESIATILTTPRVTRLYRRDFGAVSFELIDATVDDNLTLEIYGTTTAALRDETRFRLDKVSINNELSNAGTLFIDIFGLYLPDGRYITLEGLQVI